MTASLNMTAIYAAQEEAQREPLADILARQKRYEALSDRFAADDDMAMSRIWQRAADDEGERYAARLREVHRVAALIDADRNDVPVTQIIPERADSILAFLGRVRAAGWEATARVAFVSVFTVAVVLYGAKAYASLLGWLGGVL